MDYNIHLITGLSGGGAEHLVLDLSERAKKEGKKVLVISVTDNNEIQKKFEALDITTAYLNINSFSSLKTGISKAQGLSKPFGANAVVHCHMFHAVFIAMALKLLGNSLNIVFTLHNNSVDSLIRRWILFLTKPLRCKDVVFSNRGKKWYLKSPSLLPNGINLSKFKKSFEVNTTDPKVFKFMVLGSLTTQKNPLIVPEITKKMVALGHTNFKFIFIGHGPLEAALKTKITALQVENFIELLGFRSDVPELLPQFHAQVMPSLWEGMPISILESGAVGLPVVTTPVGSIPDFLDKHTGYLTTLEDFHTTLIHVMEKYTEAIEKSINFKNKVWKEFDIEVVYRDHQKLYSSCISN